MNKTEFLKAVAEKANATQAVCDEVYKAAIDVIIEELNKGEKIVLPGFGKWEVSKRAARQGVNPATGAKIQIAASSSPVFKAGDAFKKAIK